MLARARRKVKAPAHNTNDFICLFSIINLGVGKQPYGDAKPLLVEAVRSVIVDLNHAAGMLSPADSETLFEITRAVWRNDGVVVDAGSLVGSSACCLAAALFETGLPLTDGLLHCYDFFTIREEYVLNFFRRLLSPDTLPPALSDDTLNVDFGWRYRDIFEAQTRLFSRLISLHDGDIREAAVPPDIRVLVLDLCTAADLTTTMTRRFFPSLTAGAAVIHREYFSPWHPYIAISMQFLADRFEVFPGGGGSSQAFLTKQCITAAEVADIDLVNMPGNVQLALFDELTTSLGSERIPWAQASRTRLLQICGLFDECRLQGAEILEDHPAHPFAREIHHFVRLAEQQVRW